MIQPLFAIFDTMKLTLIFCLFLIAGLSVQGQNQLDDRGRKTGHWKVEYPNGRTLYEADFAEGFPVGEMLRYYENGALKARMLFEEESLRSYVYLFYENGEPAAEGWYVDQLKDSVWTYYSEFDGSVRIRESYREGKLHGPSRSFYPDGLISEEVWWEEDVKEGEWRQFYQNGAPRLSGHYENGLLQGSYEVYFSNKNIKIKGNYLDNKSHGTWRFFDEEGNEVYALDYIDGAPANMEEYETWVQDSLQKYDIVAEPESFPEH